MPVSRRSLLGAAALGFLSAGVHLPRTVAWAQPQPMAPQSPSTAACGGPLRPEDVQPEPLLRVPAQADLDTLTPRLWNWTDRPFTFQFRRRNGVTWSETVTIEPCQFLRLDATVPGVEELEYLHRSPGRATIRYADYGGAMHAQINVTLTDAQRERAEQFYRGELEIVERRTLDIRLPYVYVIADHQGHLHLLKARAVKVIREVLTDGNFVEVEYTPQKVYEYTQSLANEMLAIIHGNDSAARDKRLAELVGADNIDRDRRIRSLVNNHQLILPPGVPNASGPCPKPFCLP